MELQLHPAPGSKYTNADVRLRTPDDGRKGYPETCRVVIPINLEFSAPVGFIHKEFITMHGHMIRKKVPSAVTLTKSSFFRVHLCFSHGVHNNQ